MDSNSEESPRSPNVCACRNGASLGVLTEVQRAYEDRLELIDRVGGARKLQMQVEVLRSWVGDLVGQNTLLARAVQELETEATSRLLMERNKHNEKKRPCNSRELVSVNDTLQKENLAKEREIRKLNKEVQKYEQTIVNLRSEMSAHKYKTETSKKDAEVMVGMSCTKSECGVFGARVLAKEDVVKYKQTIKKMEHNLKSTNENVRTLRRMNVTLSEELHALRHVCAALDERCRTANTQIAFREDIIKEMRRQLNQAKAKLKKAEFSSFKEQECGAGENHQTSRSLDTMALCVQPRRSRANLDQGLEDAPLHPDSDDCHSPRLDGSGDDSISLRHD